MKTGWAVAYGVVCGLISAGLLLLIARPRQGKSIELPPIPTPAFLVVHVAGAVKQPGIYSLAPGSRVLDAIQAAGGISDVGDPSLINLAAFLEDGGRVYIPPKGTTILMTPGIGSLTPTPVMFPVNINTASQAELEALPGIGPVTAQVILTYRQLNGAFTSIEAIQDVDGIGPVTYEKIKNLITIGDDLQP
jgi:competence protein ComEA